MHNSVKRGNKNLLKIVKSLCRKKGFSINFSTLKSIKLFFHKDVQAIFEKISALFSKKTGKN